MEPSQIYILISIIVLLIIAIFVFFIKKNKRREKLSKLAGLALAFVLAGVIFGNNQLIGYSLIGMGILLAVIDIIRKMKSIKKK